MSTFNELITELCPEGVRFYKISECCYLEKGKTPIQKAVPGQYPLVVTTSERKTSDCFQFDKPTVCIPLVSSRGHGVASLNEIFYQEGEFALGNILCGVTPKNENILSAKFLHIYLNYAKDTLLVSQMKGGANVSLSVDAISRVKIPVPPIQVQCVIVRFITVFSELLFELNAELITRKKQYEYYRDLLFERNDVEWLTIAEIAQTNIGLATSVTKHKREKGILLLHNSDIQQNRIVLKNVEYISEEFALKNHKKILHKDDIITVHTGDVGTSAVIDDEYDGSIGFTTITTRIKDRAKILPRYLCHYLNSNKCKRDIASKTISDRNNLNQSSFEQLMVPVPPVDWQEYIISTLDRLGAICNDNSSGIPAEIAARQKQYEYYRDKLLTFKKLA